MKKTNYLTLGLTLALVLSLFAGCGQPEGPTPTAVPSPVPHVSGAPTAAPVPTASPVEGEQVLVRLGVVDSSAGLGLAGLLAESRAGRSAFAYEVQRTDDPYALMEKLEAGEIEVAALPSELASARYQKCGDVSLVALSSLGNLTILENGDRVHTAEDLRGRTLYACGQGEAPEHLLRSLLSRNGLDPDRDLTLEWRSAEEIEGLLASGGAELGLLPAARSAALLAQKAALRPALDADGLWAASGQEGPLPMGCLVARNDFLEAHPNRVETFLADYAAGVEALCQDPALLSRADLVPGPEAALLLERAHPVCITGGDMMDVRAYYEVLFNGDPACIGGGIPDDGFFYLP